MILSLWLVACTQQVDVSDPERAPVAVVLSPSEGSEIPSGPATFLGQVEDAETPAEQLFATWSLAPADGVFRDVCKGFADAEGMVQCTTDVAPEDARLRLQVVDRAGYRDQVLLDLAVRAVAAPVVTLTEPSTLRRAWRNLPIRVRATVTDADHDPGELVASWISDLDGPVEGPTTVAGDGSLTGALRLTEGQHRLTLAVTDPDGERGAATVQLAVGGDNLPPTLRIDAPEAAAVVALGSPVPFKAWVRDDEAPDETVAVVVTSQLDGVVAEVPVAGPGFAEAALAGLTLGAHTLTVTATDVDDQVATATVAIVVGQAPTIDVVCPVAGTTDAVGEPIDVVVDLADERSGPGKLQLFVDIDGSRQTTIYKPDVDGRAFTRVSLAPGTHTLAFTVQDEDALQTSVSVDVTVGGTPNQTCPAMDAILGGASGG